MADQSVIPSQRVLAQLVRKREQLLQRVADLNESDPRSVKLTELRDRIQLITEEIRVWHRRYPRIADINQQPQQVQIQIQQQLQLQLQQRHQQLLLQQLLQQQQREQQQQEQQLQLQQQRIQQQQQRYQQQQQQQQPRSQSQPQPRSRSIQRQKRIDKLTARLAKAKEEDRRVSAARDALVKERRDTRIQKRTLTIRITNDKVSNDDKARLKRRYEELTEIDDPKLQQQQQLTRQVKKIRRKVELTRRLLIKAEDGDTDDDDDTETDDEEDDEEEDEEDEEEGEEEEEEEKNEGTRGRIHRIDPQHFMNMRIK